MGRHIDYKNIKNALCIKFKDKRRVIYYQRVSKNMATSFIDNCNIRHILYANYYDNNGDECKLLLK